MDLLSAVFQGLLGAVFLFSGVMKFSKQMEAEFARYSYPDWFRVFTGIAEILAAGSVIVGIWNQTAAAWGGILIAVIMLGAIYTHIKTGDSASKLFMPVLLLLLGLAVMYLNL